jgi:hypothetical protein
VRSVADEVANGSCPSAQQVHPAMSVSVTAVQDGVFRRPLLAPSQFKPLSKPVTPDAFKAQLDVSIEIFSSVFVNANFVALVRKRTIPTERRPLVGEVGGQCALSLWP